MALKDKLLDFFTEHSGELYSGEELAEHFHVTRAAVWKSIKLMKDEGMDIESHGGQGYIFSKRNDILSKKIIYRYAEDNSFPIILLDTVDSTNTFARKMIFDHCENGTFILADEQTSGRGRKGHSFYSPSGTGLYASYIMLTDDNAENLLKLTIAAGVAVCETIEECTSEKPQIKWVNDIYCNRKKVCGILTEANFDFETQHVDAVIIGIGINVMKADFPDELNSIAGSLQDSSVSRNQIAGVLYRKLKYWTPQIQKPELLEKYRSYSLLIGKRISFSRNGENFTGTAIDINENGNLIIKNNSREITLSSGEVHIISWE